MASGFFDTGFLPNHNHTSVPGDGGVLANLSVTGTITSTGVINCGSALPSASGDLVPFATTLMLGMAGPNGGDI